MRSLSKVKIIRPEENNQSCITLPPAVARALGIDKEGEVEWEVDRKGRLLLKPSQEKKEISQG
jgi:antitoxin component of MazEF toxin-antitoxin module